MREYTKTSENTSRTLDHNPREAQQASISEILQSYTGRITQKKIIKDNGSLLKKSDTSYNDAGFNNNKNGTMDTMSKNTIIQRIKVGDGAVAGDLNHPEYNNIFKEASIDWYESKQDSLGIDRGRNIPFYRLVDFVNNEREQATHYKHWAETKNLTPGNYKNLLSDSAKEHMYIHIGDDIRIANRVPSEKHPHPTLAEDDPDVKCAGTFKQGTDLKGEVKNKIDIITSSSGHFRPAEVPDDTKSLFKEKAGLRSLYIRKS